MSTFRKLWQAFPAGEFPCSTNGRPDFENQCAIRMGVCFEKAGVSIKHWPARKCWQHKQEGNHILAAEELANALTRVTVPGMGKVEKYQGSEGFPKIKARTGIVFFRNFYGPGMQGDHIDLWDRWRTTNMRGFRRLFAISGAYPPVAGSPRAGAAVALVRQQVVQAALPMQAERYRFAIDGFHGCA